MSFRPLFVSSFYVSGITTDFVSTLKIFSDKILSHLVVCRNELVSEGFPDAVHPPVCGRAVAASRVAALLALTANKKTGFEPDEPIVGSKNSEDWKWWCEWKSSSYSSTKDGFLSVPARIIDLSTIIVGTEPIESTNHAALVVTILEETVPRTVRY